MIKAEQIPDEVARAAHNVFWEATYNGKPIDLEIEFDRLFHYAVCAAVNAWPGMWHRDWTTVEVPKPCIILPLPKEPEHD